MRVLSDFFEEFSTGFPQVINMVKDKGFYSLYPTPSDLTAPLAGVRDYPYEYDVFANHHFTYNGFTVCIRFVRGKYRVSCRGFIPAGRDDLRIRCDNSWSDVFLCNDFQEALQGFDQMVLYLVGMSSDERYHFQPYSVVHYHGLQS